MRTDIRTARRLATLLAVAAIATSQASPLAAQAAKVAAPVRWRGTLANGRTMEVKGIIGDVRAVLTDGREVVVEAVQVVDDPADSVRFEVITHDDGVTVCALYPTSTERRSSRRRDRDDWEQRPNECAPGDEGRMNTRENRTRVEWTVRVPAGVRLSARTVVGDVEATGLRSDVDARTVDGEIDVGTSGLVEAATISGDIRVTIGTTRWPHPLDFRTVSGGIDVTLPRGADAEVRATTFSGSITADFPLERTRRQHGGRAEAKLGRGGPALYAQTLSGTIRFRTAER